MLRKNVAGQFIHIAGVNPATGAITTGATWTMRRCLDGSFAAGGATITEDGTTGFYKVAFTQADTNGNDNGYFFTATNCVPVTVNVVTTAGDPTDAVRFGLTALPNAAAEAAGGLYTRGTGAGQIKQDANGRVDINLKAILDTTLTETAGQMAAGFKKVFDVGSPVFTAASVNQSGDNFARIGAPAGASVSADIAAVKTDSGNLISRLGAFTGSGVNTVLGFFKALLSKAASTPSDVGGTFDATTDSTEAIRDRGDAAWITATGFSTLDAAGVRAAVGLASANLDTQLLPLAKLDGMTEVGVGSPTYFRWKATALESAPAAPTVVQIADEVQTRTIAAVTVVNGLASNVLTAASTAADFVSELQSGLATAAALAAVQSDVDVMQLLTDKLEAMIESGLGSPSYYRFKNGALEATWDVALGQHVASGTTGNALNTASSGADPWSTALPGAYSAGEAGYILGTNLDAQVSTRATQASVDAVDNFVDTEIASIISELAKVPKSDSNVTLNATVLAAIADALLDRDMATGTDSGSPTVRTMRQALRFIRNKWTVTGGTLSVKKEDDATESWAAAVTGTAGADPITAIDPNGP